MKAYTTKTIALLFVMVVFSSAHGHSAHSARSEVLAPGWGILNFEAPKPGTYQLPPIKAAADGVVLRDDYSAARLSDFMGDRLVLLSFIYTRCKDANGCPLVNAVFYKLQDRISGSQTLANKVRMISMSFDPEYDTPEVTKNLGEELRNGRKSVEWEFLTTSGQNDLQPILDDYGQFTIREYDESGNYTGDFAHLLRVFLIDENLRIRNIYSASFLHPDILYNDLETLLLESSVN